MITSRVMISSARAGSARHCADQPTDFTMSRSLKIPAT
jgi:hypothetical protein